ncbi:hypothetical protein HPB52_022773 [Rhipicephalus sanguineus]|uniref:Uncharacterized protein n=1 Tax=Rhipicephalus sanguineus TaxID=34632 RepID=A0A9D4PY66_RHISA|nr:hypothetical protein HPB52_022773 [Rhipicephalus sanguineus]
MDGNINTGKTWKIIKHLLDPTATKTAAKAEMTKIRHKYKGNIREMVTAPHLSSTPEGGMTAVEAMGKTEEATMTK